MPFSDAYHFIRGWTGWRLTPVSELGDLPLAVYHPAEESGIGGDSMGIFISGDGGWGRMGTHVARQLGAHGIPVAGLDSTRYFWNPRTREEAAGDLVRIAGHFREKWQREHTVVLGYSFGADVLPLILCSLSEEQQAAARITQLILLSVGDRAELRFRFVGWLGRETREHEGEELAPCVRRLVANESIAVTAFRGSRETRGLKTEREIRDVRILPGGHFYGGHYERLAREVCAAVRETKPGME